MVEISNSTTDAIFTPLRACATISMFLVTNCCPTGKKVTDHVRDCAFHRLRVKHIAGDGKHHHDERKQ